MTDLEAYIIYGIWNVKLPLRRHTRFVFMQYFDSRDPCNTTIFLLLYMNVSPLKTDCRVSEKITASNLVSSGEPSVNTLMFLSQYNLLIIPSAMNVRCRLYSTHAKRFVQPIEMAIKCN